MARRDVKRSREAALLEYSAAAAKRQRRGAGIVALMQSWRWGGVAGTGINALRASTRAMAKAGHSGKGCAT